jgi:hypothetical protein
MGCHRPVLLENGTASVYYSSTGTLNLLGDALSYNWSFEGGTPSGSFSSDPGYIDYSTPGDYITKLVVTSSSGAVDTAYRYVSVKNKIGEGDITPIQRWSMESLSGSRGEAGYSVTLKIYDNITIDDNAVVMLLAEDWSGSTKASFGGYKNASEIFFVGYVDAGSIEYNYQLSYQTFTASSITAIMKKLTGFSVSVESKPSPGTWFELYDMDVRRALYHYLRWHTTVLSLSDFTFVGNDYKIQYYDVDRTSLFESVNGIMSNGLLGSLASDRQGRLWAEVNPYAYINPTGTFHPVMDITRRDWLGEPSIQAKINDVVSYLECGGVAYSGVVTGTYGAFLSGAPGVTPSFAGSVEETQGLIIEGQEHLNAISGNVWANRNQPYPSVSMDMGTPVRNLDIAPQEVVSLKVSKSDTTKQIEIDGLYIPSSFTWSYNSEKATLLPSVELTGLVDGVPGDTIIIPPISSDFTFENFEGNFSFNLPPFTIPTFELVIINPLSTDNVEIAVENRGVFYTNDYSSSYPTWYASNFGLPTLNDIYQFEVSATGKMYVQLGQTDIYVTEAQGGVWKRLFSSSDIGNPEGYPFPREQEIVGFGINRYVNDELLILGGVNVTIFGVKLVYSWYGSQGGVSITSPTAIAQISPSDDVGYITRILGGGWVLTYIEGTGGQYVSARLSSNGSSLSTQNFTGASTQYHTRSKWSTSTLMANPMLRISTDNAATPWLEVSGTTSILINDRYQSYISDEDGGQLVVCNGASSGLAYSNDRGATWQTTYYSGTATSVWHLGEDNYIVAGENRIFTFGGLYGGSSGTFILDKTGNLQDIITGTFDTMVIRSY